MVRDIYKIAVEAVEGEQKQWIWYDKSPESILRRAAEVLDFLAEKLEALRKLADAHTGTLSPKASGRSSGCSKRTSPTSTSPTSRAT